MKVLFNQNISGADFYYLAGQVVELPAATAQEFLKANFCTPVEEKKEAKAERAVSKKAPKRNTRAK
jgi:hypothetical protein